MKKFLTLLFVMVFTMTAMSQSKWQEQTSGTTSILRCVKALSNNLAWVSGYDAGDVLVTTNGGTNWVLKTSPNSAFANFTMTALDANTAWVFATERNSELDARIFKTTDGGSTWTQQYQNANSFGDAIHFFDANNGVAVGDPQNNDINNWVVVITTNGGTTWTRIPAANIPNADGANGEYGASNSTWALGDVIWFASYGSSTLPAPRCYRSTNKGLNWTVTPITGFAGNSAPYIAFKDINNGVAVNTLGRAARTTDGGTTWTVLPTAVDAGGFRGIAYVGGNTYVAVGGATATGICYVTRDGGATWTKIDLPAGAPRIRGVSFNSPSNGWIVANSGKIYKWIGGDITSEQATVTFKVNMRVKILEGAFVPAQDTLVIRGSFNGWSGYADRLTDPDGDSVYTITLTLSTGAIEFKFVNRHAGTDYWENIPNRTYTVPPGTSIYDGGYFDNDSVVSKNINMYFACNMELERLSGRFNPATDTVSVNGSFQGWTPKANRLLPNPLNPDVYEGIFTILAGVGEKIEFKFWYTPNNWESIPNRTYTFTQADITSGTANYTGSFNNGTLATVLNQPAKIKFTVNTNGAVSAINGQPFPVVNTVHIAGSALPLQWPQGGWPNSDSTKVIRLYDDGTHGDLVAGDKIFTNEITFPAYTVLTVKYKYGINWGDAANNGGGNDNEAGFGQDHTLKMVRYLKAATAVDTFGKISDSTALKDIQLVGVERLPEVPTVYSLSQNYPNPFNPTTTIEFGIPTVSNVTLKIYNVLGEELATLINNEKLTPAVYKYTFDASRLPSGTYIYQITAGNFKMSKKMLLVK